MRAAAGAFLALALSACAPDSSDDVPPLPKPTAETRAALMEQAANAAADAKAMEQPANNSVTEAKQPEVKR